jgi:hypothetical protein
LSNFSAAPISASTPRPKDAGPDQDHQNRNDRQTLRSREPEQRGGRKRRFGMVMMMVGHGVRREANVIVSQNGAGKGVPRRTSPMARPRQARRQCASKPGIKHLTRPNTKKPAFWAGSWSSPHVCEEQFGARRGLDFLCYFIDINRFFETTSSGKPTKWPTSCAAVCGRENLSASQNNKLSHGRAFSLITFKAVLALQANLNLGNIFCIVSRIFGIRTM